MRCPAYSTRTRRLRRHWGHGISMYCFTDGYLGFAGGTVRSGVALATSVTVPARPTKPLLARSALTYLAGINGTGGRAVARGFRSPFDNADGPEASHLAGQAGTVHDVDHVVDVLVGPGLFLRQALAALGPGDDPAGLQLLVDAPPRGV